MLFLFQPLRCLLHHSCMVKCFSFLNILMTFREERVNGCCNF